jgi:hypothetical protein
LQGRYAQIQSEEAILVKSQLNQLQKAQRRSTGKLSQTGLARAGWSLGWVSAIDSNGRTIWIVDAHRDDGKRFVVRADELLTAFLELEVAIRVCGELV